MQSARKCSLDWRPAARFCSQGQRPHVKSAVRFQFDVEKRDQRREDWPQWTAIGSDPLCPKELSRKRAHPWFAGPKSLFWEVGLPGSPLATTPKRAGSATGFMKPRI